MRKLWIAFFIAVSALNIGWVSETGSGVVSSNEAIVRTSLEATQILISDTQSNLYGTTYLGGSVNRASFDSGGVLSMRNVVSSANKLLLNNADMLSWLTVTGATSNVGLDASDVFRLPRTTISGYMSADGATITSLGSTNVTSTTVSATGVTTTSVNTTIANLTHTNFAGKSIVIDNAGNINYLANKPKRKLFFSGLPFLGGSRSTETVGVGGASPIYKFTGIRFSPFSTTEANAIFSVPDSFIGTSVEGQIVWFSEGTDAGDVSFEVTTVKVADDASFGTAIVSLPGLVTDTFTASGDVMTTAAFNIPVSWVSDDTAIIRVRRIPGDAADTLDHDAIMLGLSMKYEVQTESD